MKDAGAVEDLAALAVLAADRSHDLRDDAALRSIYAQGPMPAALAKVADHVHPLYRPWIEASPFAVLATLGPHGLDTSPRGDAPGFVTVVGPKTLLLPDRRGNQRIDSLRNLVHDPRMALLFLIPGCGEALRVNGTARISAHPSLRERFAVDGRRPDTVLVVDVATVFFQCARAIKRSGLWDPASHVAAGTLPSPGAILQALSETPIDGAAYDAALPARQDSTLY